MLKRIALCSLATASTLLFVGCAEAKKDNTSTTSPNKGTKKVSRIKTTTGLEYQILEQGSGDSPVKGKPVTVHYTGWLDQNGNPGTKFDSSVDRGTPFTFVIGVGQVIQGWDEGVLGMKKGEKRRLFIPSKLGYGARGAGRVIPANADLIFDVELL